MYSYAHSINLFQWMISRNCSLRCLLVPPKKPGRHAGAVTFHYWNIYGFLKKIGAKHYTDKRPDRRGYKVLQYLFVCLLVTSKQSSVDKTQFTLAMADAGAFLYCKCWLCFAQKTLVKQWVLILRTHFQYSIVTF